MKNIKNLILILIFLNNFVKADYFYSMWDKPKYSADFKHFDYVNPDAPKKGELVLVSGFRFSTFDKFNPFIIRGSPPAYLTDLLFDSLLISSMDEVGVAYGLLAEDINVNEDRLSVIFKIRKEAKFHNGKSVESYDIKHSFEMLKSKYSAPSYQIMLEDILETEILNNKTIKFKFKTANRELPLIIGSIPIFSRDWGDNKQFDKIIMDIPIASGPYKINKLKTKFGKDITYKLDNSYWAKDLNVNKGSYNFNEITVKIYKDNTAKLEALKAGEFDIMRFFSSGDWHKRLTGKKFDNKELIKGEFNHKLPTGFQSYVLNTRKDFLKDIKVRKALNLAMDFDWLNHKMFFNSYKAVHGIFGNTNCQAQGYPEGKELELLNKYKNDLPIEVFNELDFNKNNKKTLRENLKDAKKLLEESGWKIKNGVLKNNKNQPLILEYLDSNEGGGKIIVSLQRNLSKLGINLIYKVVDYSIYQTRLQNFDFDIITINFQGSIYPGQELIDLFSSKMINQEGSGNFSGVNNKIIDDFINNIIQAESKEDLLASCRALERVFMNNYYLIPQWYSDNHRIVFNGNKLDYLKKTPDYSTGENWIIKTWWIK